MQAARGASLNPSGDTQTRPVNRRLLALFGLVGLGAYALDQITKVLAVAHLSPGDKVPVISDLLTLTLVRNPGAAFGTGAEYTWVFTCLSMLAAVTVLVVVRRVGSPLWAVGLGLLIAGVVGNLTDRIVREPQMFHGHVIDFLQLPNWPVFNVADMCINAAAVIMVVQIFRGVRVDGTLESQDPATDPATDTAVDAASDAGSDPQQDGPR